MSVQINIEIRDEDYKNLEVVYGGLQIIIDEDMLMQFENEDELDWSSDWQPEYKGLFLYQNINHLLYSSTQIKKDSKLYEPVQVELEEERGQLILERLSDTKMRVAFQAGELPSNKYNKHLPIPKAALGYIVDIDEFCLQVIKCGKELLNYGRELDVEKGEEPIRKLVNELEKLVEMRKNET